MRIYACAAITLFALLAASALAAEDSISVKDGEDILLRTMQVVADANETSDGQSEKLNGERHRSCPGEVWPRVRGCMVQLRKAPVQA